MKRSIAVLAAGLLATVAIPGIANAGDGGVTTIATGLDNPRGLSFSVNGDLYVAEAGTGGTDACFAGPEGEACLGSSGAVTKISKGTQKRVLTGLPSVAAPNGTNAIGPTDVAARGGSLVFTVGLGADPARRAQLPKSGANLAKLLRTGGYGGLKDVADLGAYETEVNPDGGALDTNPTSVTASLWGHAVADAGANALVRVAPNGKRSTLATFPDHDGAQAVPTAVTQGPDGAFYVGELTGFPFPVGKARVYKVWPGQQPKVVADGFTNIIDIAFDQRGTLYVLELAKDGLSAGPVGALLKVNKDGSHETVLDTGLTAPGGLTIKGGSAYVANCGTCPGTGSVVKVPLPK